MTGSQNVKASIHVQWKAMHTFHLFYCYNSQKTLLIFVKYSFVFYFCQSVGPLRKRVCNISSLLRS